MMRTDPTGSRMPCGTGRRVDVMPDLPQACSPTGWHSPLPAAELPTWLPMTATGRAGRALL